MPRRCRSTTRASTSCFRLRRDIHAGPEAGRRRAAAGLPPGWQDRLANWTPESFVGQLFMPPAPGV